MRILQSTSTVTKTGELLDTLDNAEEATKAKLRELDRLADLECMRPWTCTLLSGRSERRHAGIWTAEKDGIRARFVETEFKGDETMSDVFALSSTPSTGRVIDYLSLKKSYHTSTAEVTNASFHVDEDEECYVNPPAELLEQQAALAKTVVWS